MLTIHLLCPVNVGMNHGSIRLQCADYAGRVFGIFLNDGFQTLVISGLGLRLIHSVSRCRESIRLNHAGFEGREFLEACSNCHGFLIQ